MAQRLDRIDLLRAAAMLWMTAFHFCFDLNFFGVCFIARPRRSISASSVNLAAAKAFSWDDTSASSETNSWSASSNTSPHVFTPRKLYPPTDTFLRRRSTLPTNTDWALRSRGIDH